MDLHVKYPSESGRCEYNLLTSTCLWRWNRQSVPKRRHINSRRRVITQKKAYNVHSYA